MSYKWCAVPACTNTTIKTPDKLFITVPKNVKVRNKWLLNAGRDPGEIKHSSVIFFCQDHFDIKEDSKNYIQYETMAMHGKRVSLRLKPGVFPHKFACQRVVKPIQRNDQKGIKRQVARQPEKKKILETQNSSQRQILTPKPRGLQSEKGIEKKILEHNSSQKQIITPLSQYVSLYSLTSDPESSEKMEVAVQEQLPCDGNDGGKEIKVEELDDLYEDLPDADHVYKPDEDSEFDDSATESAPSEPDEPLSPIAFKIYKPNFKPDLEESESRAILKEVSRISLPSNFEKTEEYELLRQQIEHVMVARVYRYLLKEYHDLKVQFDVSQLANVPRRTAEATGVPEHTVMHILREQAAETPGAALQAIVTYIKLDHNYYSCGPRPQRRSKPPRFRLTRPRKVPKNVREDSRTKRLEGPQNNYNKPKTKRRSRKPARYRVTRSKKTALTKDLREDSRTKRLEEPQNNCNESRNNRGLRRSLRLRETVPAADVSEDSRNERLEEPQNNSNECDEQTPSDDTGDLVMKCEVFEDPLPRIEEQEPTACTDEPKLKTERIDDEHQMCDEQTPSDDTGDLVMNCEVFEDPLQRIEEQEPTACTDEPKLKTERIDDEHQIEHIESDFSEETQVQSTAKRRRVKSEPSDEEYQQSCTNPASDKTSEMMIDEVKTETIDVNIPFLRKDPLDSKMDTDDTPSPPLRKDTDVMRGMADDRPQCSYSAENVTLKSPPVVRKKYKRYIIPPQPPEMPKCDHAGPNTFRCYSLTSDDITNFHKQFHGITNRSSQHNFILQHVLFKPGVKYGGRNIKQYFVSTERGNIEVCIRTFCGVLSIVRARVHKVVNQYAATGEDPTVEFDESLWQNKNFLIFQSKKEAVRKFLMKYLPLVSLDSRVAVWWFGIEKCKLPSSRILQLYKKYQKQAHRVPVSKQFFTNSYNTYFDNDFGSARDVCEQCALLLNNIDMASSEIEKERCLGLYKRHRLLALCYFEELKEWREMKRK